MVQALSSGVLFGLLLTVMIGPVFFALLQNSLERGFGAGVQLALGISLSDALYAAVTYFGISRVADNHGVVNLGLGLFGGIVLILFGIGALLKRVEIEKPTLGPPGARGAARQVTKGVLLNGINPAVLLLWVGIASSIALRTHYTYWHDFLFYGGLLLTVFSTDVLKAFLAHRLSAYVTPIFMRWLNRTTGVILIAVGLHLLWRTYAEFNTLVW
ncbi:MAG: LysE family translocator [Catalinimonas sp.]